MEITDLNFSGKTWNVKGNTPRPPVLKVTSYQCTMKLSVCWEGTWISHSDVNLKMRKKRVMVPLGQTASSTAAMEKTSSSVFNLKWRSDNTSKSFLCGIKLNNSELNVKNCASLNPESYWYLIFMDAKILNLRVIKNSILARLVLVNYYQTLSSR